MKDFNQRAPELYNQFFDDPLLQDYLKKQLPSEFHGEVFEDLSKFGERVVTDILQMANDAEENPPTLTQYDAWGNRVDKINVSDGWKKLDEVSATEELVSLGYKRKFGEYSRLVQFAKLYLFQPSSAFYGCPLAMTDGAARLIEVHGDDELKAKAFQHLTSTSPDSFWTSGQWMTEKTGGSDVSNTQTIAKACGDHWELNGLKWFTSATTSQMAMALARVQDNSGDVVEGSKGLSLFYIELEDNNIEVLRLKEKLGTKALPTAEIKLNGTKAKLVGNLGEGVKTIATLFNITRIYNAITAISFSRRILSLSRDYSQKRSAFGKKLADNSLHMQTLADMEVEFQGCFHLAFYTAKLLGQEECNPDNEEYKRLVRILTPLAKLYTAKQNMRITSEVLESFGGAGFIENTGIPKWLRDGQVLTIWEGTTNVLSYDVLRAIKTQADLKFFLEHISSLLSKVNRNELNESKKRVDSALVKTALHFGGLEGEDLITGARDFALTLSRLTCAALLLEHAEGGKKRDIVVANRWCEKNLALIRETYQDRREENQIIFFEE